MLKIPRKLTVEYLFKSPRAPWSYFCILHINIDLNYAHRSLHPSPCFTGQMSVPRRCQPGPTANVPTLSHSLPCPIWPVPPCPNSPTRPHHVLLAPPWPACLPHFTPPHLQQHTPTGKAFLPFPLPCPNFPTPSPFTPNPGPPTSPHLTLIYHAQVSLPRQAYPTVPRPPLAGPPRPGPPHPPPPTFSSTPWRCLWMGRYASLSALTVHRTSRG